MLRRPPGQKIIPQIVTTFDNELPSGIIPRSHGQAMSYFQEKIETAPQNGRLHKNLAPLLHERGDHRGTLKHLKAAVEFSPVDSDARNDYALALYQLSQSEPDKARSLDLYKEALKQWQKALKCSPTHVCVHKNLCAAYSRRGRYKEALEHGEMAVKYAPFDPQARRNLAKVYDAMGNTAHSIKHNRLAVRCGPGSTYVQLKERGLPAHTEHHDTEAYKRVAIQSVTRGETHEGFANEHMDGHRALAGKRFILPNSERTLELLIKTRTLA